MLILKTAPKIKCNVNGCELYVPEGALYLTIDYCGTVEYWENKPYIDDGKWWHFSEYGKYLCTVTLDDNDVWTHAFNVKLNRFSSYDDCGE